MFDYERDAKRNPLRGTQRESALFDNIAPEILAASVSLLDVGCGDGDFLQRLARSRPALALAGVDMSRERLKSAKAVLPAVELKQGQLPALPFEGQSFDTVVCSEVLEHVDDPTGALQELWRVARKQLIITVPYDQPLVELECPHCQGTFHLSGHINRVNPATIAQWVASLAPRPGPVRMKGFHTIFTYNKLTLQWPRLLRRGLDRGVVAAYPYLSFLKPGYLLVSLKRA
mgnify:FL=1